MDDETDLSVSKNISYPTFNSTSPFAIQDLYPIACLTALISVFGVFGNFLIVVASWRPKSGLTSKSNHLIAWLAVFDGVSCCSLIMVSVLVLCDWGNMESISCLVLMLPHLFSMHAGSLMIALIGVDRVLMMTHVVRYQAWTKGCYVASMVVPAVLFGLAIVLEALYYSYKPGVSIPFCAVQMALLGPSLGISLLAMVILAIFVMVIYGLAIRTSNNLGSAHSHSKRHMLVTLSLVMSVFTFTWFSTLVAASVAPMLPKMVSDSLNAFLGITTAVNLACNAYIYAARSTQYRVEFRKTLACDNSPRSKATTSYSGDNARITQRTNKSLSHKSKDISSGQCLMKSTTTQFEPEMSIKEESTFGSMPGPGEEADQENEVIAMKELGVDD